MSNLGITSTHYKMKNIAQNLLHIFLVVLLVACSSDSKQLTLLDGAESVMTSAPDSALTLLREIKSNKLNRADNARYALLLSQALDKNYIDVTDDSLINIAVEYYENKGENYYKMLTLYYQGRVKYNAQDYAMSINALLKSEQIALKLNDNFYLGLIYRGISDIYNKIYWGEGSIEYALKSYESFVKTDFDRHIDFAYLALATAYYNVNKYAPSKSIVKEIIAKSISKNDIVLYINAQKILANIFLGEGNYLDAQYIYDELCENYRNYIHHNDYINYCICLMENGNLSKAYEYAALSTEIDTTESWGLYLISKHLHDNERALYYLENEVKLQSDELRGILNQNVLGSVKEFINLENIKKETRQKRNTLLSIFSTITIFIIILLFLISKLKIRKAEIERNIAIAENLERTLEIKNSNINSLQNLVNQLFSQQFTKLDELCNIYFEYQDSSKMKSKVYDAINDIIKNLGNEPSTMNEMENLINKYYDNLMRDFRNDFPNLREDEYKLFIYLVVGFSSRAIAVLLQVKTDVVYNRKSSLKRKIKLNEECKQDNYTKYFL